MRYVVNYTIYKDGEEVYNGEMRLMLESPEDAFDVLNEQPLDDLTDGELTDPMEDISIEVNHVIG